MSGKKKASTKTNGSSTKSRLRRAGTRHRTKSTGPRLSDQQKALLLQKFKALQGTKVAWADATLKADGLARQVAHMQADFEEACQSALRAAGVDLQAGGAHTVTFRENDVEIVAGGPPGQPR